jgi:hypothetical protein
MINNINCDEEYINLNMYMKSIPLSLKFPTFEVISETRESITNEMLKSFLKTKYLYSVE